MKVPTNLQIQIASERVQSKALDKINSFLSSSGVKTITMERKKRVFKVKPKKAAPKKRATVKKKVDNIQVKPKNGNANNGGARKNAGRKKGAATKKTREIADKLVADGDLTPLEYMLQTLRETPEKIKAQYEAGDLDTIQYTLALSNLTARRDSAAKDAASYIHPRLSSIEANVGLKGQDLFAALLEKEG